MTIALLNNPIAKYDWGSLTDIARLQGREPGSEPEAELWMGAYPDSSSDVLLDTWAPLVENLDRFVDPTTMAKFGQRLPFLMKFLAIARPLSIQSHPSAENAASGFASGVFKDPYSKPEMVYALSPVEMLCGFRDESEVATLLIHLGREDLAAELESKPTGALFAQVLQDSIFLEQVKQAPHLARELPWLPEILLKHPNDPAAVAPLFINHVHLDAGEAMFVPAGRVHCYLTGFGVEVMGASDNVVRAGLTTKAVDIPHFIENVDLTPTAVEKVLSHESNGWHVWSAPASEFKLSRATSDVDSLGLAIIACTEGSFDASCGDQRVTLAKGMSMICSSSSQVHIEGSGELFRCTLGN